MMRWGRVWLLLLFGPPIMSLPSIQQLNRRYDVCVAGPAEEVMEGIRNPINESMVKYVRDLTTRVMHQSPKSLCEDLNLCPVPEKWMIPRSSLDELKDVLVRSTFDVSMESSIKSVPKPSRRQALNVSLSVFIESISSVNEKDNDFAVSLFLVQEWTLDQFRCRNSYKAMAFKGVDVYRKFGNRTKFFDYMNRNYWLAEWPQDDFKLEAEHFQLFWLPDIFLGNAKSQFAPFPSIDTRFLDVGIRAASKDINMLTQRATLNECLFRYVWKFSAKVACNMNFVKYPIDVQKCNLFFRSFAYTPEDLQITLIQVQTDPGINLGDQYLSVSFSRTRLWPTGGTAGLKTLRGPRSIGRILITLNRSLGSVFVGVMIPAILVVIIDLAIFWIRIGDLSDRIASGILCLFTLLTQFSAARSAIATNSYITLMDWFMMLCIATVVLHMMQTIAVYVIYNREKARVAEMEERTKNWLPENKNQNKKTEKLEDQMKELEVLSQSRPCIGSRIAMVSRRSPADHDSKHSVLRRNVSANRMSLRRRRRIVYPSGLQSLHREVNSRPGDRGRESQTSVHDVPQKGLEERLRDVRKFLLEPTADPGSAEYLPMQIDAVSRILFPVAFLCVMATYGLLVASIDERQ